MNEFRVVAMDEDLAEQARRTTASPQSLFDHMPAFAEIADGLGPCRVCLHTFAVGEDRRLLFTFDPFEGVERLPLPGPVYIHEEACPRHSEDDGFPEDLRALELTLNGYGRGRVLRAQEYIADGDVESTIERLLARTDIDYVHLRSTEAGCYIARIELGEEQEPISC